MFLCIIFGNNLQKMFLCGIIFECTNVLHIFLYCLSVQNSFENKTWLLSWNLGLIFLLQPGKVSIYLLWLMDCHWPAQSILIFRHNVFSHFLFLNFENYLSRGPLQSDVIATDKIIVYIYIYIYIYIYNPSVRVGSDTRSFLSGL